MMPNWLPSQEPTRSAQLQVNNNQKIFMKSEYKTDVLRHGTTAAPSSYLGLLDRNVFEMTEKN